MKKLIFFFVSIIIMLTAFSLTAFSAGGDRLKVTGLDFTKGEQDAVSFRWQESEGAELYYIYRYNPESEKFILVSKVSEAFATVHNLESGMSHYFRVLPVDCEKGRKIPGQMSRVLSCVTAPKGDLVVETSDITEKSISLSWNRIAGATGYEIYYFNENEGGYVSVKRVKDTKTTVKGLEKNTEYKFKVSAYRENGGALAYGVASDEYAETTYTDGVPHTKAQIAKNYNFLINTVKKQGNMTVNYAKDIDTEMLYCTKKNLSRTVENTANLFKGTLYKKYKFTSGKDGKMTPNELFEPYFKDAAVVRDDIDSFEVTETEKGYTVTFVLKSDSGDNISGSYCEGALSLPDLSELDTTPLKINTAETYYDKATITFSVKNGKLTGLKVEGAVLADINFRVATVSADTLVSYALMEEYKID